MSSYTSERRQIKTVVFFSLLISFLFFLFNLRENAIFFYLGMVGLIVAAIAFKERNTFLLISFLIPNLFMFKRIGADAAILGYVFLFISMKFLLKNYRRRIRVDLFLIAHIVFAAITCISYGDTGLFVGMIRFCFNFSMFSYCATFFLSEHDVKQVVNMYFAGTVLAILMGIVFHSVEGDLYNGLFAGINAGRNYFGAVVSPAVTFAILYFLEKKNTLYEMVLYGFTIMMCLISIVLSGSRTSALSLLLPVILLLIYAFRSFLFFNKKLLLLVLGIGLLVFFLYCNYYDSILKLLLLLFILKV